MGFTFIEGVDILYGRHAVRAPRRAAWWRKGAQWWGEAGTGAADPAAVFAAADLAVGAAEGTAV